MENKTPVYLEDVEELVDEYIQFYSMLNYKEVSDRFELFKNALRTRVDPISE